MNFDNYNENMDNAIRTFWKIMFTPKYDGKAQDIKKADALLRLEEDICRKKLDMDCTPLNVMTEIDQILYYEDRLQDYSNRWHEAKEINDIVIKNLSELYCKYYRNKIDYIKSTMKEWKKPNFILDKK